MSNFLKVGMILYRPPHKYDRTISEYKVHKIGRRFFYCNNSDTQFDINTLEHIDKVYCQRNFQLFVSRQAIEDKIESDNIYREIQRKFQPHNNPNYSLESLRSISAILNKQNDESTT